MGVRKSKQRRQVALPEFVLLFLQPSDVRSFGMTYAINHEDGDEDEQGRLDFVVDPVTLGTSN
jgi:hypothetical protein